MLKNITELFVGYGVDFTDKEFLDKLKVVLKNVGYAIPDKLLKDVSEDIREVNTFYNDTVN